MSRRTKDTPPPVDDLVRARLEARYRELNVRWDPGHLAEMQSIRDQLAELDKLGGWAWDNPGQSCPRCGGSGCAIGARGMENGDDACPLCGGSGTT